MSSTVFVSTTPFGTVSDEPLKILDGAGLQIKMNPLGRRLTPGELETFITEADYLIAGTEQITVDALKRAKKLKLISRVGVGLDNIPFEETKKLGIKVTYTPQATTDAVAELTLGLMIDLARRISIVDQNLKMGIWNKHLGTLLKGKTIGIIGLGRIGKKVATLLGNFDVKILGNDLIEDKDFASKHNISFVSKEEVFKESDFVTFHTNYSESLKYIINTSTISQMKESAFIINTSRGLIVNEDDLYKALKDQKLAGAALDVYIDEPYNGILKDLQNVILTAHIGAATIESRLQMELGAATEVVRFHSGKSLQNEVNHA